MSRIRSVKPEWLDDELVFASSDARVLSIALILLADDYGNGRAHPVYLLSRAFPGKVPETLANALEELRSLRYVALYEVDGQKYFTIRNWNKHQRVDKPGKPSVPPPPASEPKPRKRNSKQPESLDSNPANPPETPGKVPGNPANEIDTLAPDQEGNGREGSGGNGAGAPTPKLAKPWRRVPDTWQRKPEHDALADELRVDVLLTEAKFRDHEFARPKRDADATFRNWIRETRPTLPPKKSENAKAVILWDTEAGRVAQ